MPITKSAKKSLRVSLTKRAQNRLKKVELDRLLKKVSVSNVSTVISKIDKAAKTHILTKNKAARMKSQLTKKFGTPKVTKSPKVQNAKIKTQKDGVDYLQRRSKSKKKTAKKK